MYNIAFCDDNIENMEDIVDKIRQYGKKQNIEFVIQKFDDSDMLMEWIESRKLFDVYFLDIEMPFYSGIDLAKKISEYSNSAIIVFLTAYEMFAVDVCGMKNVIRYLLKDSIDEKVEVVLDEVIAHLTHLQNDMVYVISNQRKYMKLLQRDIIYVYKNQKNAVFVMTDGSEEKERSSLQAVFEKLRNQDMIWLDRGIILNRCHICRVTGNNVIMDGGYRIIASVSNVTELKKNLSEYWGTLL